MGLEGSWKGSTEVITNSRKTREWLLSSPLLGILPFLPKPDLSVTVRRKVLLFPHTHQVSLCHQSNTGLKKLGGTQLGPGIEAATQLWALDWESNPCDSSH